jgi:hypothetical protein
MSEAGKHLNGEAIMNTIYYDPPFSDERRREELYQGQLLVYSPRRSTLAFIEFARKLIKRGFCPL